LSLPWTSTPWMTSTSSVGPSMARCTNSFRPALQDHAQAPVHWCLFLRDACCNSSLRLEALQKHRSPRPVGSSALARICMMVSRCAHCRSMWLMQKGLGTGGQVRVWNIPEQRVVDWADVHEMVTATAFAPDGRRAVVGTMKGRCRFYQCEPTFKLEYQAQIGECCASVLASCAGCEALRGQILLFFCIGCTCCAHRVCCAHCESCVKVCMGGPVCKACGVPCRCEEQARELISRAEDHWDAVHAQGPLAAPHHLQ
jgi:hypothetical protein